MPAGRHRRPLSARRAKTSRPGGRMILPGRDAWTRWHVARVLFAGVPVTLFRTIRGWAALLISAGPGARRLRGCDEGCRAVLGTAALWRAPTPTRVPASSQ